MDINVDDNLSLLQTINILSIKRVIKDNQTDASNLIIDICNKADQGISIPKKEAMEAIEMTEELNKRFSLGYLIACVPNENYEEQELVCEWEHCIEKMPYLSWPADYRCHNFGHKCPGGIDKVSDCDKRISDINKSRFING